MILKIAYSIVIFQQKKVINFSRDGSLASNYDSRIFENGFGEAEDGKGILLIDSAHVNVGCSFKATSLQWTYFNNINTTSPPSSYFGNATEYIQIYYQNINPIQIGGIVISSSSSIRLSAPLIFLDGSVINNRASGTDLFFDELGTPVNQVWSNSR